MTPSSCPFWSCTGNLQAKKPESTSPTWVKVVMGGSGCVSVTRDRTRLVFSLSIDILSQYITDMLQRQKPEVGFVSPEEEIVASSPQVPDLLDFRKGVENGFTVLCVGVKVLQSLYVHRRVDP